MKENVVGEERGKEGEGEDDNERNEVWTMKENFEGFSECSREAQFLFRQNLVAIHFESWISEIFII